MWGQNGRQTLREIDAEKALSERHFGEYLDSCANDFQRAQACRAKAEKYRNLWFAGQREMVAKALLDETLGSMTPKEREATGEHRWSISKRSRDLAGTEQMYWRWMDGYLDWYANNPKLIRNARSEVTLRSR